MKTHTNDLTTILAVNNIYIILFFEAFLLVKRAPALDVHALVERTLSSAMASVPMASVWYQCVSLHYGTLGKNAFPGVHSDRVNGGSASDRDGGGQASTV